MDKKIILVINQKRGVMNTAAKVNFVTKLPKKGKKFFLYV
tara:strand:+ start:223 stop:342 length:120 start_codon:yes stop_codon:yes gene_type:complete